MAIVSAQCSQWRAPDIIFSCNWLPINHPSVGTLCSFAEFKSLSQEFRRRSGHNIHLCWRNIKKYDTLGWTFWELRSWVITLRCDIHWCISFKNRNIPQTDTSQFEHMNIWTFPFSPSLHNTQFTETQVIAYHSKKWLFVLLKNPLHGSSPAWSIVDVCNEFTFQPRRYRYFWSHADVDIQQGSWSEWTRRQ